MSANHMGVLDRLTAPTDPDLAPEQILRGNILLRLNQATVPNILGEVCVRYGFIGHEDRVDLEKYLDAAFENFKSDEKSGYKPDDDRGPTVVSSALDVLTEADFDHTDGLNGLLIERAQRFGHWLGERRDIVIDLTDAAVVMPDSGAEPGLQGAA